MTPKGRGGGLYLAPGVKERFGWGNTSHQFGAFFGRYYPCGTV